MKRHDFIYRIELLHRVVSVYIYLADRTNKERKCWLAVSTIARELKLSETTIRRAVKKFAESRADKDGTEV